MYKNLVCRIDSNMWGTHFNLVLLGIRVLRAAPVACVGALARTRVFEDAVKFHAKQEKRKLERDEVCKRWPYA